MKVKIVEREGYQELEESVNMILSVHKSSEIFDIKYSGSGSRPPYGTKYFSAMIIFNDSDGVT